MNIQEACNDTRSSEIEPTIADPCADRPHHAPAPCRGVQRFARIELHRIVVETDSEPFRTESG